MKNIIGLVIVAALVGVVVGSSCAGPNPWLKPQGELVQLERQAKAALDIAKDPRTRGALQLCITSAQAGAHRIDELIGAEEQLRQAKKQNVEIPELQDRLKLATAAATRAEDLARADCAGAGVHATGASAVPDGGAIPGRVLPAAGGEDGGPTALRPDAGAAPDMIHAPAAVDGGHG